MFFHRHTSRIFVIQSENTLGRVSGRREIEDVKYTSSNEPFSTTLSNTRHLGSVIPPKRLNKALVLLICVFLLFVGRSAHLQIFKGDEYYRLAEANRFRTMRVLPQRGLILDRRGEALAQNIPSFVLTMTIADLPRGEEERRALFARVSELSGVQPTDLDLLLTEYARNPSEAIPVKRHIAFERAMHLAIETKNLPGFALQTSTLRQYPANISSLSHVLGYTGKMSREELEIFEEQGYESIDPIGKIGVERSAEATLRGQPGEMVVEIDAHGKELSVVSKTDPTPGVDVHLTIDAKFQQFIEERLAHLFDISTASRASVVALNPKTGEVYALVSLPSYDNNLFAQGIETDAFADLVEDKSQPLFFRAISGEFPSGSTFKPFVAYAALADRIVSERTSFVSTGGLRVGDWFFPDWKSGGHGVTDVRKAISESVNTFFYTVGGGFGEFTGLGVERMTQYAERFGFGRPTGIDLPEEATGFLPSKKWKEETKGERWYVGDTYHLAIGQGDFLTTPLQMAHATGIIANNGIRVTPHVIMSETAPVEEQIPDLDTYSLSVVKQGMRQTVVSGSARSLAALPFSVAGKTGTAQAPGYERFHSWFTGFAPYEDPEIAVSVLVEEGGESAETAVPLARELLYWWFTNGKI
jgi:penicillin-binding protein 2